MAWFPWRRADHDDGGSAASGDRVGVAPPLVSREELEGSAAALRSMLAEERARVRPDTWRRLWDVVESAAELAPLWERAAGLRSRQALELFDVLTGPLPRLIEAFLALPDSMKPAHADEFDRAVRGLEARARRSMTGLARAHTAAFQAEAELPGEQSQIPAGPAHAAAGAED